MYLMKIGYSWLSHENVFNWRKQYIKQDNPLTLGRLTTKR